MNRIGLLLLLFGATPALSQDILSCLAIPDYRGRVQCARELGLVGQDSNTVAEPVVEAPIESLASPNSAWEVNITQSPLDDSTTVILSQNSLEQIPNRTGQLGSGTLFIRCLEGETSLYLWFNGQFMADIQGYGRIDFRIDGGRALHRTLSASTDNMALGEWSTSAIRNFIPLLFRSERLFVRATPYNASPVSMTFDITGLEAEIAPLREACGW